MIQNHDPLMKKPNTTYNFLIERLKALTEMTSCIEQINFLFKKIKSKYRKYKVFEMINLIDFHSLFIIVKDNAQLLSCEDFY